MGDRTYRTWVTLFAFCGREVWMPWKASSVMEERLRFVARLLDGEAMTDVCRDFGVSRKTGYKVFDRYKEHGLEALSDRSRRPVRYANQLPQPIDSLIVRLKGEKPHWGARKIRELLVRRLDGNVRVPAKSTIHAVLDRHGLVKRGGGPRHRGRGLDRRDGRYYRLSRQNERGMAPLFHLWSPYLLAVLPTRISHAVIWNFEMQIERFNIEDVLLISPIKRSDQRGFF